MKRLKIFVLYYLARFGRAIDCLKNDYIKHYCKKSLIDFIEKSAELVSSLFWTLVCILGIIFVCPIVFLYQAKKYSKYEKLQEIANYKIRKIK